MFRFSTIIRELEMNLAKVIFILKHSVKLRRYLLCGCVAAYCIYSIGYPMLYIQFELLMMGGGSA